MRLVSLTGKARLAISFTILLILTTGVSGSPAGLRVTESNQVDITLYEPGIDSYIENMMSISNTPSLAAAIIRDSNIIWAKGYGEQPETDMVYMIGSITKVFTTVSLLQLYEQGHLDLDDDVSDILPFTMRNPIYPDTPITFRMLLSHTSSLGGYTDTLDLHTYRDGLDKIGFDYLIPEWPSYPEWFSEYFLETGSVYESSIWTTYEPETHYIYSNVGFDLLAYIIEVISGDRINEYVSDNILTPLGMDHTGYNITDINDENKLAIPYVYEFEVMPGSGNLALPHYNFLGMGGGAMRSNIFDLARFSLVFSHGGVSNGTRILSEESVNLITRDYLGWLDFGAQWDGHGGLVYGFVSHMLVNLGQGTSVPYGVIVFTNQYYSVDANLAVTYTLTEIVNDIDADTDLFPLTTSNITFNVGFLFAVLAGVLLVSSVYLTKTGRIGGNRISPSIIQRRG